MIFWLENSIRRVRRYFSRSEWAVRHLHLSVSENTSDEHGLLMIQIDGLSHGQLEKALRRGQLPFLRSLLRRQYYKVHDTYSGLPSTTPSVQAELFYGVRCAVPAFSFLHRDSRRIATMYNEDWARKIEEHVRERSNGALPLLQGGSSWSNIYSGGAEQGDTHFCAANIGPGNLFKSASFFGILGFIALHFPALIRLFVLLLVEFFLAVRDLVRGVSSGQNLGKEFRFLVSRIMICIGLREIVTAGAKIDLARGLPIVHVNFLGYDEQSHCRGPGSAYAHWSLRGIDKAIRELYCEAYRSARRDYQVWIYSDHGQEAARSYAEHFDGGIEATISRALEELQRKAKEKRNRSQQPPSRAYWSGGRRAQRKFAEEAAAEKLSPSEEETFAVTAMGPVGNVYFKSPLDDNQKRDIADWLVNKGHVPGVLYKTSTGQVLWVQKQKTWKLPQENNLEAAQPDDKRNEIVNDLVCLCENVFAGDILLLGCNPGAAPWTFPMERGAHGGPGPNETHGFAMLPVGVRLPKTDRSFLRPSDLRNAALHFLRRQPLEVPAKNSQKNLHLRTMTYNVHGCLGMDGKISPRRIARVIETYQPDIVALQEIDLGRARSRGHDQAKMIAEELGMHVAFCPTISRGGELYGHALLSRFPLEIIRAGPLQCPDFSHCEPRGALLASLQFDGQRLHVLNTHLGLNRLERVAQITDLLSDRWLGKVPLNEPLMVHGDFNMMPGSIAYRALIQRLHDAQLAMKNFKPLKTFASSVPIGRIDHIFVSGHFEVKSVQVPKTDLTRIASDHLPLLVDLEFVHVLGGNATEEKFRHLRKWKSRGFRRNNVELSPPP